jgi:SpoVK/Ycf46/Vps4 family AAA+-type ATPase
MAAVTFEDVAGLSDAKKLLKEAIVIPYLYPQLFQSKMHIACNITTTEDGRQPWRRVLMYGPPGTGIESIDLSFIAGKTRLAQGKQVLS